MLAIAGSFWGPWFQDVFNQAPDLSWTVVPLPTGPGGHEGAIMWMGWGINANSEHPEEAWQLLRDAVPFYDRDRYFAPDIAKATALIVEGKLAAVLPEAPTSMAPDRWGSSRMRRQTGPITMRNGTRP